MKRTRVKICGITNLADALQAVALGADAIGLNFHPASPRCVSPEAANAIIRALPPLVEVVGVYVGTLADGLELARQVPLLRTLQRHAATHERGELPAGVRLIEAFQVPGRHSFEYVRNHLENGPVAVLIDGSAPGQFGGTGHAAPWHELAGFDPGVPVILAGGLHPDNVAEAIRIARPYAVDVASGVESAPGQKDVEKMRRFIQNARVSL